MWTALRLMKANPSDSLMAMYPLLLFRKTWKQPEVADPINKRQISLFSLVSSAIMPAVHSEHGPLMGISGSMSGHVAFQDLDILGSCDSSQTCASNPYE